MWISWNHDDSEFAKPLAIHDKIEIFYQQALGWQLHIADLMINGGKPLDSGAPITSINHSGFAVLHICLSYVETIGNCRTTKRRSEENFNNGALEVFLELKRYGKSDRQKALKILYLGARCGLYHNSRTGYAVGLGQNVPDEAIAYDPLNNRLAINPHELPRSMKRHLYQYQAELQDPANGQARSLFEHWFDQRAR
jgi:hypothetical protein